VSGIDGLRGAAKETNFVRSVHSRAPKLFIFLFTFAVYLFIYCLLIGFIGGMIDYYPGTI